MLGISAIVIIFLIASAWFDRRVIEQPIQWHENIAVATIFGAIMAVFEGFN